jgi:hypothetical protein
MASFIRMLVRRQRTLCRRPGAAPTTSATQTHNTFARYFADYYEGNFYDRLGTNVTKPTISAQTPEATSHRR